MGESVDSVLTGSVERASGILEGNLGFLEDDIDALTGIEGYIKANKREVSEEIEITRNSLLNYQDDLTTLEDHVIHVNEEYTLPMDVDDAETVVKYLDIVEERLDQLENRRKHELRRMPDIISDHTVETINNYFEDEEFDDPVLYDIDEMRENIYEARENIQVK
ncbi:hypothetical protein [Candidatus Nanohalobium constans]|uniref:Uncharacterized protein n=1 Tax=Candidatus Nanohalobium constans TaxID=2565781 RepID=A0A5Q0UHL8_9ARCH|nr:hypothetical protein [Candidatus Nanohalobium constans]QGA80389.1 hypothetical protein LC1Nh_0489 [Candidatus Nanohalobium constans]